MADVQKKAAPAAEKTPAKTVAKKKSAPTIDSEEKEAVKSASPPKMKKIVKRSSGDEGSPKPTPKKVVKKTSKPSSVAGNDDGDATSKVKKTVKKSAPSDKAPSDTEAKKPVEKGIDTPKKKVPSTPKKAPAPPKVAKEESKPEEDASQADNEDQNDDDVFEDSVEESQNEAPEAESSSLKRVDSGKDLADDDNGDDTERANDDDGEEQDDEDVDSDDDPFKDFKQGLKSSDKQDSRPQGDKPDFSGLSQEEMDKLTVGKDFDISKYQTKEKEPESTTDDATNETDDAADEATEKADDAADEAEDAAEEGKSKLGDIAEDAEDTAEDSEENLEDTAKEGEDKLDDVTKEGESKLDDTAEEAKDTAKDGEEKLEDSAKEGEEKLEDSAEDGEAKLDDATDEGKDKLDDATKDVEEKTDDDWEKVDDSAKEGEEKLDDATKEGEDELDDATKDGEDVKAPELAEGENALKEGEEKLDDATKEGEDKVDDATKEGEEATKEGDEALKEGEEAKEGAEEGVDDAAKEGEEAVEGSEDELDISSLKNGKVNKGGNVMVDGKPIGRITQGVLAHLVGKSVDENGIIWNDSGKQVGKAELIPDDELQALLEEPGPFESFPDATVNGEGFVLFEGERVGKLVEGDAKKLRGMKVDSDGDVLSRAGEVLGKAERWEPEEEPEPEAEPEIDNSILAGKRVNKLGYLVDSQGQIFGRVVSGDPKRMLGRMSDKQGIIRSESGDELGRAEVVPEGDREGTKQGSFADLEGCTVGKDGKILTPDNVVVGRLVEGDAKKLFRRPVDSDGEITDGNGNVIGKAERWEEPEEPEKEKGPLAGKKVNKEGLVCDADGNPLAKLTSGDLSVCVGKEVDDDNDVVVKGTVVGHVTMLADIKEPEPEEKPEEKEAREKEAQDKKLAQQMSYCLTGVLDKIKPICSMITSRIEKAERTPKEELDEEDLVKEVRPLIEEGGKILQEANGIIRGLDPDGRIQQKAKHRTASREASPEEYHLADILKELTGTVTQTIENAKKKIEGMPHAKKELNPLWGLLNEPLFQILAAVGMLLNGVLGIVGRLLSGLGLGGLVDGLLGGLGIKNILQALGVGGLTDSLTGKNQKGGKKKGGLLGLGG